MIKDLSNTIEFDDEWEDNNSPDVSESNLYAGSMRGKFERWVRTQRLQSVERYSKFPFSYKIVEVNTLWEGWKGAYDVYA